MTNAFKMVKKWTVLKVAAGLAITAKINFCAMSSYVTLVFLFEALIFAKSDLSKRLQNDFSIYCNTRACGGFQPSLTTGNGKGVTIKTGNLKNCSIARNGVVGSSYCNSVGILVRDGLFVNFNSWKTAFSLTSGDVKYTN